MLGFVSARPRPPKRTAGARPVSRAPFQLARLLVGSAPQEKRLQPIQDLIGPEALEAMQRLVQHGELVRRDSADLLDRAHVLLVERAHRLANVAALFGELDADRA